ncbi:MAG: hypothetical protein LWX51_14645 [Deltaproteobacteria bacterium]|jgi:hypothetical protein|nr:hypothetical protein [Deltaproteobacteria bacterium]
MTTKWCPICKDTCKELDCRFFQDDNPSGYCIIHKVLIDFHNNLDLRDLSALIEKTNHMMDSPL